MAARRQPYRHIYILPMDLHSGHHLVEDQTATEKQIDTPVKKFGTESDSKLRRSYIECQHQQLQALLEDREIYST
ncbi:unnamed protein product [Trifolium pratense]|uniref:Uncharacterized protein n=1 Tax=Trifolium pratense TaxID=57577 RepID=A0ACB0JII5_TRIPR|nr:unnamed protein product [Trifolium pratense]